MSNCSTCEYWKPNKHCVKREERILYCEDCLYYERRRDMK